MVLVEGENADGITVDEESFDVNTAEAPTVRAADQVVSAILGTQEGAAESGYQLCSTGVTWTDPAEAAALRDALAARKVENVMLVSSFLAAAALAQVVGNSVGYEQTGLLFVEPGTATLALVSTADGSITDVHRQPLPPGSDPVAQLSAMASRAEALETRPDGLFVVGSGVDIAPIKAQLEAATSLIVSAPEEPETALARGAALASANAPLFSSSTTALAYAQDPGNGAIDQYAVAPGYFDVANDAATGGQALAYSAVPDEDADAYTALAADEGFPTGSYTASLGIPQERVRRPLVLVVSAVAAIFVVGAAALVVALAVSMRPTAAIRPEPGHNVVAPAKPAPAPPAAHAPAAAPPPAPAPAAPAPAPAAPAPAPAAPAPEPAAPVPAPVAPAPVPVAPAPAPAPAAPVPAPIAPPPAPAAPPLAAPVPIPIPIPVPPILSPPQQGPPLGPWGGDHGGGGWGHGGYPGGGGIPGGGGGFPGGGGHGGFGGGAFGIPGLHF
ncbi:hypothetical protein M5I08_22775 [Candidatus Mycobacterium methanotrophicum]|uniref:DUF7159 domain-containing protein n=1 Tax=Candidatus Mycobacterium methanotrophicum TaxID=2943498 RepID=A0ABY4QTB7_9MYCO|nr:hypothetical protein [Candidatus Mycobacterium methanotrophicum]UQX13296.1 hypothetical protein M5I08_22775 [Candidatus Mycobacterium methanotrophicum]